jgi:hypothetical protein
VRGEEQGGRRHLTGAGVVGRSGGGSPGARSWRPWRRTGRSSQKVPGRRRAPGPERHLSRCCEEHALRSCRPHRACHDREIRRASYVSCPGARNPRESALSGRLRRQGSLRPEGEPSPSADGDPARMAADKDRTDFPAFSDLLPRSAFPAGGKGAREDSLMFESHVELFGRILDTALAHRGTAGHRPRYTGRGCDQCS